MTTIGTESLPVQTVIEELATEFYDYASFRTEGGSINGEVVATCFKNVVCLEHRTQLLELPQPLWELYSEASTQEGRVYALPEITAKLARIGSEL